MAGSKRGQLSRIAWRIGLAALLLLALFFAYLVASAPSRLTAVPAEDAIRAQPLGLANARFYPGPQQPALNAEFAAAVERQRQHLGLAPGAQLPAAEVLAISGGGDNGAFASGLLVGWTAAGNRPEFELVTGVSTGALLAPFAFLGAAYDAQLREVYTSISAEDIYVSRGILEAFYEDALADTSPLFDYIAYYFDEAMLAAVAAEYRKGRLLLIASTNLDAQRPSIWNIGAIAASGHPDALSLVRQILRASSALPGLFQPVMIDVELEGRAYQELHVDGGTTAQLFLYPPNIDPGEFHRERQAYLILNGHLDPQWAEVERRTVGIAARAIATMIHYAGINDLLRLYYLLLDSGLDYNLAFIGSDFALPHLAAFEPGYMNALFAYGHDKARAGYPWEKVPPILSASPLGEGN